MLHGIRKFEHNQRELSSYWCSLGKKQVKVCAEESTTRGRERSIPLSEIGQEPNPLIDVAYGERQSGKLPFDTAEKEKKGVETALAG